jgi:hypothetical protein
MVFTPDPLALKMVVTLLIHILPCRSFPADVFRQEAYSVWVLCDTTRGQYWIVILRLAYSSMNLVIGIMPDGVSEMGDKVILQYTGHVRDYYNL